MHDTHKPKRHTLDDKDGNLEPPPKKLVPDPAPTEQQDGNLEPPPKVVETPATG